ncbi:MAG TPA: MEKHLA domain-containing protein [Cytophagaceae bacterium]|nr:MEKHLA domain-containing protein [Cytophagaceae bacterium]
MVILSDKIIQHITALAESFFKLTGTPLVLGDLKREELAKAIYEAPFVVVSHGTESDPVFNFANQKAQELWEMTWEEFTILPSRLSAEPMAQSDRERLLARAQEKGYVDDYNGIRISKSGKRFHIHNTILWNITDSEGHYRGQAAMFKEWKFV